jgi:hypothetical protein
MEERFIQAQIVAIWREAEAADLPVRESCRKHGIAQQTYYR